MNTTELLIALKGLTKEQVLTLWESSQKEITSYREWMNYLDSLPDQTGFNQFVVSSMLRVVSDMANKYESYEEVNNHFDEIRKKTKDMCLYLSDFKRYFKVSSKKQMMEYDLSIYKF